MNTEINYFVDYMKSAIMNEMITNEGVRLFDVANALIDRHDDVHFADICQAYEVVKHELLGTISSYRYIR